MLKLNRRYFPVLKGKKVIFEVVKYSPDIIAEFVDRRGDYKVKIDNNKLSAKETIKVQIVTSRGDIKLEKVERGEDFEIFIKQKFEREIEFYEVRINKK